MPTKIVLPEAFVAEVLKDLGNQRGRQRLRSLLSRLRSLVGIALGFLSSFFFIAAGIIVQSLTGYDAAFLSSFRFAGILLFTIPLLIENRTNPFGTPETRFLVLARGLLNATSLYLRFLSLQLLPIAEASVIAVSQPLFVCIFARVFLKEAFGKFHACAIAITFLAIALTARVHEIFLEPTSGEFGSTSGYLDSTSGYLNSTSGYLDSTSGEEVHSLQSRLLGIAACVASVVLGAAGFVIVRKIKSLHHSVILFNFAWISLVEMLLIAGATGGYQIPADTSAVWLIVALGVFSFYDQYLVTKGLQLEEAGLVVMMRASGEIVFAFVLQIAVFAQIPDFFNVSGAALVMATVVLISIRKYVEGLPETSLTRKVFGFVTK